MNFMFWDLSFLGLFALFVGLFLYQKRKEIRKEGLLYLYHTKWGIDLINKTGKKYKKTLKVLSYFSVSLGYILMALMIYFFGKILWVYVFHSDLMRGIKLPPIMPLIPYLPQMFKLDFLPPLYFSYWIAILAIIAISHEFFHGIFAKLAGIKTKTTGFGFFPFFFPVFLAAFVNLDEKVMEKKRNFEQRAVLSAGTFANIITAIIGVVLMWGVFSATFVPAGIIYDDYAYGIVNISSIQSINGVVFENLDYQTLVNITIPNSQNKILANGESFYGIKGVINSEQVLLYYDSPAINMNLTGPIGSINGEAIDSLETLSLEMAKYGVGDTVTLSIYKEGDFYNLDLVLAENPSKIGKAWLGITFFGTSSSGVIGKFTEWISSYKKPHIFYLPSSDIAQFVYDFLWWLVLISFSVALVNMLPVGIFDGGRFFYLTILSLTKSEKIAEQSFKWITNLFIGLVVIMMLFWAKNFF